MERKEKQAHYTNLLILGMERAFYFYLALPFTTGRSERASWLAESLARSSVPHSSAATHASSNFPSWVGFGSEPRATGPSKTSLLRFADFRVEFAVCL